MDIQYLERPGNTRLAYVYSPPADTEKDKPVVMFLGGYRSDMNGTKATDFEARCRARGQGYLRFDYSGHGLSEGEFEDGTIGSWMNDALSVFDHVIKGPVVLVGSSMGGWISLLVALERAGMIHGLVGIAAAPDFTEDLYSRLSDAQKEEVEKQGRVEVPNDYSDEPYAFTWALYEEAKSRMLLDRTHTVDFSMRLIQGMQDKDVPPQTAIKIQEQFDAPDSDIVYIEDGGHSLSRPEDLEIIDREIKVLSGYY